MAAQDMNAFDYIVVGAGCAGCVVANRLSADGNRSVLLLEAGGNDDFFTNTRFLDLPSLFSLWGPATDWGYSTEPSPSMNNRAIPITQGKVLGGGSSTNGRIYLRGNRRDYDRWAAAGNTGWGYKDFLPYIKKYENYSGGENEYHGVGGPVSVLELPNPTPISQAFLQAAVDHGFNGPADVNGAQQENSVGFCQSTTTPDLARASTAVAYIHPIMDRSNFTLKTDVLSTRVLFEGTKAVGVEYLENGNPVQARANAEVIVSCGGFNTPKLLQLSGVGPADHLKSHDIPVVADVPGVGENLQDHLHLTMSWHLAQPQPQLIILSEVNLFAYTKPGLEEQGLSPDLQFMFAPFFFPQFGDVDKGITLAPTLAQPESRGTVRLRSANPLDPPVISPNYLSNQSEVDVLRYGIELGREIMAADRLKDMVGAEVAPGPDVKTKDQMDEFVRNDAVTVWHPSCSARMGTDDMAAVDPQLRVRGVEGLRVVDGTIMPQIVNANLQATIIAIGEKGADLILSGS
jgi:choline dehydrogenase